MARITRKWAKTDTPCFIPRVRSGEIKKGPLSRGAPCGCSFELLGVGRSGDRVRADGLGGLEALGAGLGHVLVLLHAVAAHADAADELAVAIEGHAARELDQAVLAVRVADV